MLGREDHNKSVKLGEKVTQNAQSYTLDDDILYPEMDSDFPLPHGAAIESVTVNLISPFRP